MAASWSFRTDSNAANSRAIASDVPEMRPFSNVSPSASFEYPDWLKHARW